MTTKEPKEVVEGCMKHDRKCQYKLYNFLAPKLLATCLRYTPSRAEAEDVLQESFIKIFAHLDTFRLDSKIDTWSIRIMLNILNNKFKWTYKYANRHDEIETAENITEVSIKNEGLEYDDLLKILHTLPELHRNVFNLFEIEGYTHKEIGEMFEISESTSRVYLYRAKILLQQTHKKLNY